MNGRYISDMEETIINNVGSDAELKIQLKYRILSPSSLI